MLAVFSEPARHYHLLPEARAEATGDHQEPDAEAKGEAHRGGSGVAVQLVCFPDRVVGVRAVVLVARHVENACVPEGWR